MDGRLSSPANLMSTIFRVRPPPRPYGQAQGYQAGNYTLGGVPSNKFSSSPSVGNSAYNGLNSRAGAAGIHGHQNGTSASGNFQQGKSKLVISSWVAC